MPSRSLTIYVYPGEPVPGLWCDQCQLPSGVEWPLVTLTPSGVGTLQPFIACTENRAHKPRRADG